MEITNIRSPRVKAARRLAKRAFRERDRAFLAEGPQAVREALHCVRAGEGVVTEVFATAEAMRRHSALADHAAGSGIPVHAVSGEVIGELTQTVTPQGLVAVCRLLDTELPAAPRLVAVLAYVRDPGNAGTVLRAADAAGADAVVFTDASVDPYNGKCVRASAGSLFHLPVVRGRSVADAVQDLKAKGLRVVAADGNADVTLDSGSADLAAPTAWIFGNEAWGLPEDVRALADEVVGVPIYGRAESLNLATAAAVCLYASARVHRGF